MEDPKEPTSVDPTAQPLVVQPEVLPAGDSPAAKLAAMAQAAVASPEAEPVVTPGAGDEGVKTPPEPPKERTFSQEEWNKREAAVQARVTESETKAQAAVTAAKQQAAEAVTAHQKREDEAYIAKVDAEGGNVEFARATVAKEASVRAREAALEEREAGFTVQATQAFEIAKRNDAERLARDYGLTDVESLMTAENPTAMELIASKAALEVAKTGAKPPVKTDNAISTTTGADWSKLNPQEKVLQGIKDMPGLQ